MTQSNILIMREAREIFENEGLSNKEIAAIVGRSPKTISYWSILHKWDKSEKRHTINGHSEIIRRHAKSLYTNTNMKLSEIAARVGVSSGCITAWRKRFGWPRRRYKYEITTHQNETAGWEKPTAEWPAWASFKDMDIDARTLQLEDIDGRIAFRQRMIAETVLP